MAPCEIGISSWKIRITPGHLAHAQGQLTNGLRSGKVVCLYRTLAKPAPSVNKLIIVLGFLSWLARAQNPNGIGAPENPQ